MPGLDQSRGSTSHWIVSRRSPRACPISVPLTGIGMLLTGAAVLRCGRWRGWPRYTPLACGLVPFVIELPGFITVGDSPNLHIFIACTSTSWLVFFIALRAAADQASTVAISNR